MRKLNLAIMMLPLKYLNLVDTIINSSLKVVTEKSVVMEYLFRKYL